MAVDGSVNFNTKINTDGFEKGTKGMSSKLIDLKAKVAQTERQVESLTKELEEMADTPIKSNATEKLENDIAKAKSQLNSLYAEADKIGDAKKADYLIEGVDDSYLDDMLAQDKDWQKVQSQIDETERKLQSYEQELKRVQSAEGQVTGKDTAEYAEKREKLQRLLESLAVYKARMNETEQEEKEQKKETNRVSKAFKSFKSVVSKAGKSLASAFKNGAVNLIKKIGSHAKKSASNVNVLSKSFNMVKQALSGILIYQGISKIFDAAKEGMQNLAQASSPTNKSLSMLMSALTRLKNSFATAFAPILNVVAPILTTFINLLSSAADKVAQLFTALSGQSTYTKAVAVQQDYAASVADSTKKTKDNTKATDENQKSLAGYDELNVMQDNSSSDTASADTTTDISPSEMFTTANITNGIGTFAQQLKDLINKQDFKGVGTLLGKKVNGALKSINWKNIRSTVKSWAANIANFLNGAISEIDWSLVGSTLGNGVMTLFDFAYTFLTTFDFVTLGTSLADIVLGFFNSVDWATVGGTFGALIQSAISTGFGFVTEMDENEGWADIGQKLSDLVNGFWNEIDWGMAAETISSGIKGLLTTITEFITNINWAQFGQDIGQFLAEIDWMGILTGLIDVIGAAIDGLFDLVIGFIEGLGLADWLRDNLGFDISEFLGNIKKWLGGLIDFISGVFTGDWEKAWNGIKDFFTGIWNNIWSAIKGIINLIIGGINDLWTGIYNCVKGIVDSIGGIAGAIGDVFGQDWHFSMPEEPPLIPKLATGTYVPANYGEFLAILGDNKREAEVVSPVSAMKQAFLEALTEGGYNGGSDEISIYIDGDKVFKAVVNRNNRYKKSHGKSALA